MKVEAEKRVTMKWSVDVGLLNNVAIKSPSSPGGIDNVLISDIMFPEEGSVNEQSNLD